MPTYTLTVPPGLLPRLRARAQAEGTDLDTAVLRLLDTYATTGMPGRAGAQARSAKLTPAERSAIARRGAVARWGNLLRPEEP